jgi:hypothetical protein
MNNLDLALIGNCSIGALIDARAEIVWACFPRFDGDRCSARCCANATAPRIAASWRRPGRLLRMPSRNT